MTDNGICGIVDVAVRRVLNVALDEDGHVMVPVTDATDNPLSVSAGEKPAVFKEFAHDIAVWPVLKGWNGGMAENIPLSEIVRHENSFMSAPEEVLRRMDDMVSKFIEETGGEDVYYQGSTDKKAPVSAHFTYYLDGKEITPEARTPATQASL